LLGLGFVWSDSESAEQRACRMGQPLAKARQTEDKASNASSEEFYAKLWPQQRKISADIKERPLKSWEGHFYNGPVLERWQLVEWIISDKLGYVSEYPRADMGKVEVEGDRVKLTSERPPPLPPGMRRVHELRIVRWGTRTYLVGAEAMINFCNNVNSGRLYGPAESGLDFCVRRGDENKQVAGLPLVPKEYREHLLKKPVRASITRIRVITPEGSVPSRVLVVGTARLTVDAGKEAGLRKGMVLFQVPDRLPMTDLTVTSVAERTAEVQVEGWGEQAKAKLILGARLSTRSSLYDDAEDRWRKHP
jgi:hypothetical protein